MNNSNEFAGVLDQANPEEVIKELKLILQERTLMIKSFLAVPEPGGQDSFDLIKWAAEETKQLATRDKEFFYLGIGQLYSKMKEDRNTVIRELTVARAKEIDALQKQDNRYRSALQEISKACQVLKENPNCAYILDVATKSLSESREGES
jgi:hypothetical protein